MPYPWGGGTRLAREFSDLAKRKSAEVSYNHMEGFVSAKVLVEGLQQAGPSPTRESLVRVSKGSANSTSAGTWCASPTATTTDRAMSN